MFKVLIVSFFYFFVAHAFASENILTFGVLYENVSSETKNSILFQPQEISESNFEMIGISLGYMQLAHEGFGINSNLDISQISKGISHQSDLLTHINGSGSINYGIDGWLYPYFGFQGTLHYYKLNSSTWKQVFGGVGWQYGIGLKHKNLFFEIFRSETSDRLIDFFGNGGTNIKSWGSRLTYCWSF